MAGIAGMMAAGVDELGARTRNALHWIGSTLGVVLALLLMMVNPSTWRRTVRRVAPPSRIGGVREAVGGTVGDRAVSAGGSGHERRGRRGAARRREGS